METKKTGTTREAVQGSITRIRPRPKITEEPIPHLGCFGQIQQCTKTLCWDADGCQTATTDVMQSCKS